MGKGPLLHREEALWDSWYMEGSGAAEKGWLQQRYLCGSVLLVRTPAFALPILSPSSSALCLSSSSIHAHGICTHMHLQFLRGSLSPVRPNAEGEADN